MLAHIRDDSSVGENTYHRIRHGIVFGELAPGQKLRLDGLRKQYDTSVSTLRELLSRLASEGLVSAEGQRGFQVAPVSARDLRELADMRQLLEWHALEQSFAAGDLEWEGRIVAAHHKLARVEARLLAGESAESSVWKRYDWEFHHALISACGSSELLEIHADIYDKYLRYQMVVGIFRGKVAAREHARLLQCALDRDIDTAKAVLATHIQACVEAIVARKAVA
jgi:DNA-binding GntR family transcriptional regulator